MKKSTKNKSRLDKNPLVSVIIPCFNHGSFLSDSIGSLRKQSYPNIEIILVNDGSTDDSTNRIINEIDRGQEDIKVINQSNTGLVGARNNGIKNSRGDYIVCLDADDKLDADYITKTMAVLMRDPGVHIVTTWLQEFGERNGVWKTIEYNPGQLLVANGLHAGSLYRREVWLANGGYNKAMKYGYEDWEFWISAASHGYKWAVVKEPLFIYRTQQGSMLSRSAEKHEEIYANMFELHQNMFRQHLPEVVKQYCSLVNTLRKQDSEKGITIAKQQRQYDALSVDYNNLLRDTSPYLIKAMIKLGRLLRNGR